MKKTTKLGIWEVWNEYIAESVFIDHKPTKKEILTICEMENWRLPTEWVGLNGENFIKKYIHIEPLRVYQTKK